MSNCIRGKGIILKNVPRMITCQHDFIQTCLETYKEIGLSPGNPLHGEWHKAHYPVPKCLGGEDWIWLLISDHAVHGVLQSLEFKHRCVRSWEKKNLPTEYLPLYEKAMLFTVDYRPSPKGTKWINDGKDQKRFSGDSIPQGWCAGRLPVKWITNGEESKMIPSSEPVPGGWKKGRTGGNPTQGKKWINNGENNKLISPEEKMPDGWVKGFLK